MDVLGLPKLLPLWHNISLKEQCDSQDFQFGPTMFPDHGGVGIDVSIQEDVEKYQNLKSVVNAVNFGAEFCALPFLPPNKGKSYEPCLELLNQQREKQTDFCRKLNLLRSCMKKNAGFRKAVLSVHLEASQLRSEGKSGDLALPESVCDLAKIFPNKFPIPCAQWSYSGGSLAAFSGSSCLNKLLLHSSGRKLNRLVLTATEKNNFNSTIAQEDNTKEIKLYGGKILQIVAGSPLGLNVCCVRQKKRCRYLNVDSFFEETQSESFLLESFDVEDELSYVAVNDYIPGEFVVVTKQGFLLLRNAELKRTVWQSINHLTHDPIVDDEWWGCDFGAHPRSLLYADRRRFSSLDLRSKKPESFDILSSPNPFLFSNEQLMVTKRLDNQCFQHLIATDVRLFICDERYPQQPLMSWNHMLKSFPLYCDVKTYSNKESYSDLVVLLGTQESQDIASFHVRCSSSDVQPLSLTLPMHLSAPRDCVQTLQLFCSGVNDHAAKRLGAPLTGICALPHSDERFTVFQQTSFGDIFYQDLKICDDQEEKTNRVGPGCILIPPSKLLPHLSWWLDCVAAGEEEYPELNKETVHMDIEKIETMNCISNQEHPSLNCVLCKQTSSPGEQLIESEICSCCGLHTAFSKQFSEAAENLSVLAGTFPSSDTCEQDLSLVDLSKMDDRLSKRLLKVWSSEEMMGLASQEGMPESSLIEKDYLLSSSPFQVSAPISNGCMTSDHETTQKEEWANGNMTPVPHWLRGFLNLSDEETIPPSQELHPKLGETLRTPKIKKNMKVKLNSSAGF